MTAERAPAKREFSAGGVVVRQHEGQWQVAVIKPAGRRVTALPKGHIDPGEDAAQAATREVREETGLTARLDRSLGDVQYVYRWKGTTIFKVVSFFLFFYESGDIDVLAPEMRKEVDVARWVPLATAPTQLSFQGERDMTTAAIRLLEKPAQL